MLFWYYYYIMNLQSWQDVAGILNNFVEFVQALAVLLVSNVHFEVTQVISGNDVFKEKSAVKE